MVQNRKETKARKRDGRVKTHRTLDTHEKRQSPDTQVPPTSRVAGLPPTANLNKHPDEAYGDTEIPQRGQHLDNLKAGAN